MKINVAKILFAQILLTAAIFSIGCSSSSKQGSITPNTLDYNSFSDLSSSSNSFVQTSYNPSARLESEIAPGYLIELESMQDSSLNGKYRISEQGQLELPYDVKVKVGETSLAELRSLIRDSYRTFFRGTPDIEVAVRERKVWIKSQGLVNKPGTYLVEPLGGLDEVISLSGGLRAGGDGISAPRYARINVSGQDSVIRLSDFYAGNSNLVTNWRGGESVFFQNEIQSGFGQNMFDAKYVHVLGQVRAPGEYAFKDQAHFLYYLVQAGGPTDRANTEKILLVSLDNEDGKFKTSKIALSELEDVPPIKGGDVLFIQADNRSDFERDASILGSLGGFVGSIATAILVGDEL